MTLHGAAKLAHTLTRVFVFIDIEGLSMLAAFHLLLGDRSVVSS